MTRIFLDTSIIFSATLSSTGASREILKRGLRGEYGLVISDVVVEEAQRNIVTKYPQLETDLQTFFSAVPFEIVQATQEEVIEASHFVVLKDAPIIAGAKHADVSSLITMDKKHLFNEQIVPVVKEHFNIDILLPDMLINTE